MSLFTETAFLRRRGEVIGQDGRGNDVRGPDVDEASPAWWEPREGTEATSAEEQYVSGYWLYLPLEAPLTGADAVVLHGLEYEVVGEPGRQPGGFTVEGFQKVAVKRVTG